MPTPKQMEKLAAEAARRPAPPAAAPAAPLPAEYWESVLKDPRAGATGAQIRQRRLSEIQRHVLRVSCRRCERTVEIQTADAVRLYGGDAVWKDVAQRLLDNPSRTLPTRMGDRTRSLPISERAAIYLSMADPRNKTPAQRGQSAG
jgi:hypothetical protein